jgi:hypothetical protein
MTRIITDSNGRKHITNEPLLHPPQRTWVGLTDEDKQDWIKCMPWPPEPGHIMVLIEGIESELKDLNR